MTFHGRDSWCGRLSQAAIEAQVKADAERRTQASLLSAEEELRLAEQLPDGAYLSPAAQELNEKRGAERFAKFHPRLAKKDDPQ